jgi:energy-coupling factor transport system ATP-binding protein
MQTSIIVLDEPTANLDPLATQNVHSLILRLRAEGVTVILVTKELDEFLARADQVLVLHQGSLVRAAHPQALISEHGDYLAEELGIWLPEVCELGLGMRQQGFLSTPHIPLTVAEALAVLEQTGFEFLPSSPNHHEPSYSPHPGEMKPEKPVLVSATELTFSYPGQREALKGVSFEVRQGDLLAIVGRNGAGKSTLSKLLVGLLKPKGGQLALFGRRATQWNIAELSQKIALVFQNPEHQFLTDTVFDEIAYSYLSKAVVDPAEVTAATQRMLAMLALEDVAHDHPFALSAGNKRRLGVAAMLVGSPEILIVDEPTYGQDKTMTHSLMKLILELKTMGIAVIMITHDMRLVEEYADRVIVMNEGLITFDGQLRELFRHPELMEQASLTVTTLQTLVNELSHKGQAVPTEIRSVSSFLNAMSNYLACHSER